MPARPEAGGSFTFERATRKLSGSGTGSQDSSSEDATRAALGSALGRWADAGGVGTSSGGEGDSGIGGEEPSWTSGMWENRWDFPHL